MRSKSESDDLRLDEAMLLAIMRRGKRRGRVIWSPTNILHDIGIRYEAAKHRSFALHLERMLRSLADRSLIALRSEPHVSRFGRTEKAYELLD
jgi:hypothetical protein